jgi:tRNA (pseudouridine54-N1)-methyltransferase
MKRFILRARAASTDPQRLLSQLGTDAHVEIIAHATVNALYISGAMRAGVEFYVVLDSTADFPRTIALSTDDGISLPGFDERSVLGVLSKALEDSRRSMEKDQERIVAPGLKVIGTGFEKLVARFLESQAVYLLDPKGEDIAGGTAQADAVYVLSDHIPLPPKSVKSLLRRGAQKVSVGPKMLFASQCIVLIHNALDRQGG